MDRKRVVVANADQVVVVLGADYLAGGVRFLDRVLVAASAGGLDALVCVNKVDLAGLSETVVDPASVPPGEVEEVTSPAANPGPVGTLVVPEDEAELGWNG